MLTPKFSIGDPVYHSHYTSVPQQLPCPECHNTRKWQVTTPAGGQFTATCQRCVDGFGLCRDLPSLTLQTYIPHVQSLTIGSIRIDTADSHPISYMCKETGVGSGSIYREEDLFSSQDEALAAATAKCAEHNAKLDLEPSRIEQRHIGTLTIADATNNSLWRSWYILRSLREDIAAALAEDHETMSQLKEAIEHELTYTVTYRDKHPLDTLLTAARSGNPAAITKALEAFPAPYSKDSSNVNL